MTTTSRPYIEVNDSGPCRFYVDFLCKMFNFRANLNQYLNQLSRTSLCYTVLQVYWSMRQGLCYGTVSVRLSVPFARYISVRRVCCCESRRQTIAIDCCTARLHSAADFRSISTAANASSVMFTVKWVAQHRLCVFKKRHPLEYIRWRHDVFFRSISNCTIWL